MSEIVDTHKYYLMSYFNGQELFLSSKTQGQPLVFLSLFTEQLGCRRMHYCVHRGCSHVCSIDVFKRSSKVFSLITIEFLIHFYLSVFHIALKAPIFF